MADNSNSKAPLVPDPTLVADSKAATTTPVNPAGQPVSGGFADDPVFEVVGICHDCQRRRGVYVCEAYPDGIPVKILTGEVDHHFPQVGDHGLQFVQKAPAPAPAPTAQAR